VANARPAGHFWPAKIFKWLDNFFSKHLFEIFDFFFARQNIFEANFWPAKPFVLKILPTWSKGWPPLAYTINSQFGVRVPLRGYASSSQGVRGILNPIKISPQQVKRFWGYAKGVNFGRGVRQGVQY
jgi:hypothetical protein